MLLLSHVRCGVQPKAPQHASEEQGRDGGDGRRRTAGGGDGGKETTRFRSHLHGLPDARDGERLTESVR